MDFYSSTSTLNLQKTFSLWPSATGILHSQRRLVDNGTEVTLYTHGLRAPNPPKVAILLEELGVEFQAIRKENGDGPHGVKTADFLKINPYAISGIGPMQGQHFWFNFYHPVKLNQSVYERFESEAYSIYNVLEKELEKHEWLANDTFTVVELKIAPRGELSFAKSPKLEVYVAKINAKPSVKKAYERPADAQN
ncbi:hypothetical protein M422DRAFT_241346 [Sphaerobolus stellatus SS14]|nr:hypothetical protein M422DRAFT_241346 [Sphaerobolus stellatus SS14]